MKKVVTRSNEMAEKNIRKSKRSPKPTTEIPGKLKAAAPSKPSDTDMAFVVLTHLYSEAWLPASTGSLFQDAEHRLIPDRARERE